MQREEARVEGGFGGTAARGKEGDLEVYSCLARLNRVPRKKQLSH